MRSARLLVTGGGGFIGSHLIDRLLEDGCEICVLDNFATGRRENLAGVLNDIDLIEGDIRSSERVHAAARGCDAVIHEAALPSVVRSIDDPVTTTEINVIGTLNVLVAARDAGVGRVVLGSSSSVYGGNPTLPKTEDLSPDPVSPYAVSKLAAERYCRAFTEVYGLETVVLRYFNVFGPRQDPLSEYAAVVPRFIATCLAGDRPTIYGDGEQSRDFTYVENIVDGTIAAVEADGVSGRVFNIAAGAGITVNALVSALEKAMGSPIDPVFRDARPGEVRHSEASIDEARTALRFEPGVGFREGLSRTIEFFEQQPPRRLGAASGM